MTDFEDDLALFEGVWMMFGDGFGLFEGIVSTKKPGLSNTGKSGFTTYYPH